VHQLLRNSVKFEAFCGFSERLFGNFYRVVDVAVVCEHERGTRWGDLAVQRTMHIHVLQRTGKVAGKIAAGLNRGSNGGETVEPDLIGEEKAHVNERRVSYSRWQRNTR